VPQSGPYHYDVTEPETLSQVIAQHSQKHTLTDEAPYALQPHQLILGRTLERIELPTDKGTPLTLEIINLGPMSFVLRPGMHIAQLIVEEVRGEVLLNPSAFQDQSTPEGGM